MLNNLFGKRKTINRTPDQIWRSRDLEFKGLLKFITALDPATTRVLLIAHFAETLRALEQRLNAQQLDFLTYSTTFDGHHLCTPVEYQNPRRVLLALAQALPESPVAPSEAPARSGIEIQVLVVEHHPLASFDDQIIEFAQHLPYPSRIGFYDALDGTLLRHFGGMDVAQLMTTLQIPDDECISSSMIDKTIRRAQGKIGRQVAAHFMTADSGEEWFQRNLPRDI